MLHLSAKLHERLLFSSLLFSSLLLVSVNKLSGQQAAQFITEVTLLPNTLNESESSRWQTFSQKATTQSISLVEIGSLTALLNNGKLTVSIPNGPQNLEAEGNFIKEEDNGDYVWWANLTDQTGYIGVAKNSTGQFVAIQKGSDYYQFHPLSSRYNAMVKTNTNVPSPEICPPLVESPPNITGTESNCDVMGYCKAVVSVLVLVTPEALNSMGFAPNSIDAALYIPFGLHSINFALVNSGIFGKSFRFIVEGYNFNFSSNPNITTDLIILQNDQAAFARKTANRADLMVLLTDDRYDNALGIWRIYSTGPTDYGMVSIENMFGVKNVFAHEIGHAFALNHSREQENYFGHDVCNFGWYFLDQDFVEHKTIMATISDAEIQQGMTHILNYSNPDSDYNGAPTGTQFDANAFKISQKMCLVQDNFEDEELEVSISGNPNPCNTTATYTADFLHTPPVGEPGGPPYVYAWYKSNTGFFNPLNGSNNQMPEYLGNTPSISILINATTWLKLDVCGQGVCVNHVLKVKNCDGEPQARIMEREAGLVEQVGPTYKIMPNPVHDALQLSFNAPLNGLVTYSITNSLGQLMTSSAFDSKDLSTINISLSGKNLPSGMYYCSVLHDNTIETRPFSIIR